MKRLVAASMAGAVLLGGCMLFTGSTDGYSVPTPFACQVPTDCQGGQVCCLSLVGGVPGSQCQSSCSQSFEQVCTISMDCGDGGTCLTQSCSIDGGTPIPVSTCGAIPQICAQ
jgi:hypothetical protein